MSTARQEMMAQLAEARRAREEQQVEREYTPPIALGGGFFQIDTTPDGEGDLEVYSRDGDHVAYLDPTDQLTLRDLLNRLHPQEPQQVTTVDELDALPVGSVIIRNGRAFTRFAPRSGPFGEYHMWQCPDGGFVRSTKDGSSILPATVLHVGEAGREDF